MSHQWRSALSRCLILPLLGCSVGLISCGQNPVAKTTNTDAPPLPQNQPSQPALGSLSSTGLKPKHDDPKADGWSSEAATDAINAQLKKLKAWLSGETTDDAEILAILDPSIAATALLPERWDTDFASGSIVVKSGEVNSPFLSGRESLLGALKNLQSLGADLHVAMKIIRITAEPAQPAQTTVDLELDAETKEGQRRQLNSSWEMTWSEGHVPQLLKLQTSSIEDVLVPKEQAWRDVTASVLRETAPWREQLCRPLDHWCERIESLLGMEISGWHGLSVGDLNGDGADDLIMPDAGGLPNRLFLRQADGTLKDITAESAAGFLDASRTVLIADFDNDGDADLCSSIQDGLVFSENDGKAHFKIKATVLAPAGYAYGLAAADYDQDADLDIFVACYHQRQGISKNFTFARPVPYHDAENGAPNMLLRNDGAWRFAQVGPSSGLDAPGHNSKFSYAPTWQDYDGDGDLDLYVANDFGRNNLWKQERNAAGEPLFTDVAEAAGVLDIAAGMSSSWGDVNNDGLPDLWVGNMFSSAGNRITTQSKFLESVPAEVRALYRRHARGNSLFLNKGDGSFEDVSETAQATLARWAWSSKIADIDNDTWPDLLVANGFITQHDPHDL